MTTRSRRWLRLLVLAMTLIAAPLPGMADGLPPSTCQVADTAGTPAHAGAHCCERQQQHCDPQSQDCAGVACGCPQGTGHAPVILRIFNGISALVPSGSSISASVATLILATAPEGQWRPPRSA